MTNNLDHLPKKKMAGAATISKCYFLIYAKSNKIIHNKFNNNNNNHKSFIGCLQ